MRSPAEVPQLLGRLHLGRGGGALALERDGDLPAAAAPWKSRCRGRMWSPPESLDRQHGPTGHGTALPIRKGGLSCARVPIPSPARRWTGRSTRRPGGDLESAGGEGHDDPRRGAGPVRGPGAQLQAQPCPAQPGHDRLWHVWQRAGVQQGLRCPAAGGRRLQGADAAAAQRKFRRRASWRRRRGCSTALASRNIGLRKLVRDVCPVWATWDTPVVVNVLGETVGEFATLAGELDGVPGVAGLELNISCPNLGRGGDGVRAGSEGGGRGDGGDGERHDAARDREVDPQRDGHRAAGGGGGGGGRACPLRRQFVPGDGH